MSHEETIRRVNLAECPYCHQMPAELVLVTSDEGFVPMETRVCRQCSDELRFRSFDTKRRRTR